MVKTSVESVSNPRTRPKSPFQLAGDHPDVSFVRGVHAPQWPAPIALFVLSLVIGTVYHRTGSLIAAIFMHATFNGLSTLADVHGAAGRARIVDAEKVADETSPAWMATFMRWEESGSSLRVGRCTML